MSLLNLLFGVEVRDVEFRLALKCGQGSQGVALQQSQFGYLVPIIHNDCRVIFDRFHTSPLCETCD